MIRSYICIGTNCERERNLSFAVNELTALFPDIALAPAEETEPIGMSRSEWFTNQVGLIGSELTVEELKARLKQIERAAGRCQEDKAMEIVRLDIDLLSYGNEILKPADMERDYVKRGVEFLKNR